MEERELSANLLTSCSPMDDDRMSYTQIVEEFASGESIYLASLETLWLAYLLPLTNACHRGEGGSATAEGLLEKFGGDLMQIIACHKLILAQLVPSSPDDDASSNCPSAEQQPLAGNVESSSPPLRGGVSSLGLSSSSSERNSDGSRRPRGLSRLDHEHSPLVAFPLLLLRMAPSMQIAYNNYVLHFTENMLLAETARRGVEDSLWEGSYAAFARDIMHEKLSSMNIVAKRIDTSFAALIAAPMQRLARYSLLISEWMKEHDSAGMCSSGGGGVGEGDDFTHAARALQAIQGVCKSVNQTQAILENARRLLEIQQRFRITGLSTQLLLNEASVTHAVFPLNSGGIYGSLSSSSSLGGRNSSVVSTDGVKFKVATIFLFSEIMLIVHFRDCERKRRGSIIEIPLTAIESVRNLKAIPSASAMPSGGFVLKISPGEATSSKKNGQKGIDTEYVILDDDELSVAMWVQDVTMAVHELIHAS